MSFRLRRINDNLQTDIKLFNLPASVTSIGRHSESNLCLISKEHPCLTSRLHAEIHCISNSESEDKYLLRDASLNGTYVNNRRVFDYHLLDEGDIITFGHYGGHLIKKGEIAPKKQAEFQFVFESVERDVSSPEARCHSSQMSSICQRSYDRSDDDLGKILTTSIHGVKQFTQSDSESSSFDLDYERSLSGDRGMDASYSKVENRPIPMLTQSGSNQRVGMSLHNTPIDSWSRLERLQSMCNSSTPRKKQVNKPIPVATQQHISSSDAHTSNLNSARVAYDDETSLAKELNPRYPLLKSTSYQNTQPVRRHSEQGRATRRTSGKKRGKLSGADKPGRKRKSDDVVYHSSKDKCASIECLMPKSDQVLWVQCDDCDAWYHATCAGCTSSASQLAVSQFRCGCN